MLLQEQYSALLLAPTFVTTAIGDENISYSYSRESSPAFISFVKPATSCSFVRLAITASSDKTEQEIGGKSSKYTYTTTKSRLEVSLQEVNQCGANPTTTTLEKKRMELTAEQFSKDAEEAQYLKVKFEPLHDGIGLDIDLKWPRDHPPKEWRVVDPTVFPGTILTREDSYALRPVPDVKGYARLTGRDAFYADAEKYVESTFLKWRKVKWSSRPQ